MYLNIYHNPNITAQNGQMAMIPLADPTPPESRFWCRLWLPTNIDVTFKFSFSPNPLKERKPLCTVPIEIVAVPKTSMKVKIYAIILGCWTAEK